MRVFIDSLICRFCGRPVFPVESHKESFGMFQRICDLAEFQARANGKLGTKDDLIRKTIEIYDKSPLNRPTINTNNIDFVTYKEFDKFFEDTIKLACVSGLRLSKVLHEIRHASFIPYKESMFDLRVYPKRRKMIRHLFINLLDRYLGFPIHPIHDPLDLFAIKERIEGLVCFRMRQKNPPSTKHELSMRVREMYLKSYDGVLVKDLRTCTSTRVTVTNFREYFDDTLRIAIFAGIRTHHVQKLIDETVAKESKKK